MSKNYNLEVTYDFAVKKLATLDPHSIAVKTGCPYDQEKGSFDVNFLGTSYHVTFPEGKITWEQGGEIPLHTQILLLHYLIHAKGTPFRGDYISYKEIPDGSIYIEPFTKRAIKPLVDLFGASPAKLLEAASKLGGEKAALGHVSVTIPVFPRIALTYVLWEGDDEFPPSGNIVFDGSAGDYLPAEDYAHIAGMIVWTLKKLAG